MLFRSTLHVTNATLDQLDALNADAKVTQIQVREGTSAVSSHLAALANTTTLNQISLNDTAALQISASDYATYPSTLAKICGNFKVVLRDALISDA